MMLPAIFGNFAIDDLVFPDGTTRWAVPGGSAAYAALGAALWAGSASAVAPLGDDYPLALLSAIDTTRCRQIPHTMRNWGLYEEDGSRCFVSRSRDRDWSLFCPSISDVHTGRQTAAHLAPMPFARASELIDELRRCEARIISLDLDNHDVSEPVTRDEQLEQIRAVDLFLPSKQDMQRIFPGLPVALALRQLREYAPAVALIAIKCGAAGVVAHIAGSQQILSLPSAARSVADTTGAGDAFCGAVLAGFASHADPLQALLQGTIAAACCVEAFGLSGLREVDRKTLEERLRLAQNHVESSLF